MTNTNLILRGVHVQEEQAIKLVLGTIVQIAALFLIFYLGTARLTGAMSSYF